MSLGGQRGEDGARDKQDGPPRHLRTRRREAPTQASSNVAAAPAINWVAKSALTDPMISRPATIRVAAGRMITCFAASACRRGGGGEGTRRRITAIPVESRT